MLALSVLGIFETGSLELFALAGFKLRYTWSLPSSYTWVARITGVSHWPLDPKILKWLNTT
jgi:hypothetical protein